MDGIVVFLVIAFIVRSLVKKGGGKRTPRVRTRSAAPAQAAPAQTAPVQPAPAQSNAAAAEPSARHDAPHRHVEFVPTQAEGYSGEGDESRYHAREVSCETAGHKAAQETAANAPVLRKDNLMQAIVMTEILSRPKALRGGVRR